MKPTTALLALLISCSLFAQNGNSIEILDSGKKKFPVESGKITYTIDGTASGQATCYFDRYGWRQMLIKEITLEQYGIKSTEKTIVLIDGDKIFSINQSSKKGTKSSDPRWSQLAAYKENSEILSIVLEDDGGTKGKDSTLVGKPVQLWTFSKGLVKSAYVWNGLNLMETKSAGKLAYKMTATDFMESKIDESVFVLPNEIEWVDLN
ncbi:MAG: hypothetical protein ABJN36_00295 [Cyclobacteriaceae bacterium]